jgi:hypothetical protein
LLCYAKPRGPFPYRRMLIYTELPPLHPQQTKATVLNIYYICVVVKLKMEPMIYSICLFNVRPRRLFGGRVYKPENDNNMLTASSSVDISAAFVDGWDNRLPLK